MKKYYEYLILFGFIVFFAGGLLCVGGQMAGLLLGNPALILGSEGITKIIFPAASLSGLLCFLYGYLFKNPNGKVEQAND